MSVVFVRVCSELVDENVIFGRLELTPFLVVMMMTPLEAREP